MQKNNSTKYLNLDRVVVMSLGFFIIMNATGILQNIIPTLMDDNGFGKLGYFSTGICFAVFAVSSLFMAPQIKYFGDAGSMIIGSITYCFFTGSQLLAVLQFKYIDNETWASLYWPIYVSQIVMAMVCGWGNALLFVCSSKYVNECANEGNKGLYNSLLWTGNVGAQISGNLIAAFVIPALSQAAYLEICLLLNILVCFFFILVKPPRP
jgi:hypothetical protein